jgi:hypothetical protein
MIYCMLCLCSDHECVLVRVSFAISRDHSVSSLASSFLRFYILFRLFCTACHRGCSVTLHGTRRALTCLCLSPLSHFVSGATPCSTQA